MSLFTMLQGARACQRAPRPRFLTLPTGCDNVPMTALFAGLTTLDVLHRLDHVPDPLLKVTSTDFTMAAGGPATNAAVTYAALNTASRSLSGSDDEAGATSYTAAASGEAPMLLTALGEGPVLSLIHI